MEGTQHQMSGKCRLDSHISGFQIADFTDHYDVWILPHQGTDARGEI